MTVRLTIKSKTLSLRKEIKRMSQRLDCLIPLRPILRRPPRIGYHIDLIIKWQRLITAVRYRAMKIRDILWHEINYNNLLVFNRINNINQLITTASVETIKYLSAKMSQKAGPHKREGPLLEKLEDCLSSVPLSRLLKNLFIRAQLYHQLMTQFITKGILFIRRLKEKLRGLPNSLARIKSRMMSRHSMSKIDWRDHLLCHFHINPNKCLLIRLKNRPSTV